MARRGAGVWVLPPGGFCPSRARWDAARGSGRPRGSPLLPAWARAWQLLRLLPQEQLGYEERACEGGRFAAVEVAGKPFDEASKEGVLKLLKYVGGTNDKGETCSRPRGARRRFAVDRRWRRFGENQKWTEAAAPRACLARGCRRRGP